MKRHPLERIVSWLVCTIASHKYVVERELNDRARKVRCNRCGKQWAMHDPTRSFVPWDADFEAMYAPGGLLARDDKPANTGNKPRCEATSD